MVEQGVTRPERIAAMLAPPEPPSALSQEMSREME